MQLHSCYTVEIYSKQHECVISAIKGETIVVHDVNRCKQECTTHLYLVSICSKNEKQQARLFFWYFDYFDLFECNIQIRQVPPQ